MKTYNSDCDLIKSSNLNFELLKECIESNIKKNLQINKRFFNTKNSVLNPFKRVKKEDDIKIDEFFKTYDKIDELFLGFFNITYNTNGNLYYNQNILEIFLKKTYYELEKDELGNIIYEINENNRQIPKYKLDENNQRINTVIEPTDDVSNLFKPLFNYEKFIIKFLDMENISSLNQEKQTEKINIYDKYMLLYTLIIDNYFNNVIKGGRKTKKPKIKKVVRKYKYVCI